MATTTTMTSRERVLAVLDHELPDRVPVWCGATPEFWRKACQQLGVDDEGLLLRLGDDFRRLHAVVSQPKRPVPAGATGCTPFGVPRRGVGYGQTMRNPLAFATLRDVHRYDWPDLHPPIQLVGHPSMHTRKYAVLGGTYSLFWHDMLDLLGQENAFIKMHEEPRIIDAVLQHVVDYHVAINQRVFESAKHLVDIFFIANDFGCQRGPFISEAMFRRFIAPHLRRLAILGHSYGLKVMLHSCGSIRKLIPAIVECGIDALHPLQPCRGMDLAEIKATFGKKLVLNGGIDAQHTLIKGSPKDVREKTREVLRILKPESGYIGGASHDTILGETPVANVLAMFDTLRAEGEY